MLIKLPNGLIDGSDHFTHARIDELRGKQQNYLSNKELVVGNIGHIPKILEDLVLGLETEQGLKWGGDIREGIYKLSSGDLETVLLKIRENTYGPRFYHEAMCSHCGHHHKQLRLNLDELEIKPISMEERMASKTVNLPKSQKKIERNRAEDELTNLIDKLIRIKKKYQKKEKNTKNYADPQTRTKCLFTC
jgi:hypothetical protein